MLKAVIIDDVSAARENLQTDISQLFEHIKIVGTATGVVDGTKLIKQVQPELVFLDISLNDGTAFDLLEIIGDINFRIIFTTASDAYALKAFKYSAVDYLLKPIDLTELKNAVEKVFSLTKQKTSLKELISSAKEKSHIKRIALNTQDKIVVSSIDEILRAEADINYTHFYFKNGQKLLVTKTLKEFEDLLDEHNFLRVHQSHLVNLNCVKEFIKADGGYLLLQDGTNIPVSTRKKNIVLQQLSNL